MENYASKSYDCFRDPKIKTVLKPVKHSAKKCLKGFQQYLNQLTAESVKKDNSANDKYIVGAVYKNNKSIIGKIEHHNFAKASLSLANKKFNEVVEYIEKTDPTLKLHSISKCKGLIKDFIFDVKPFVEYFERKKDPNFQLFKGWKSYENSTFEVFLISNNLYWNSIYKQNIFDEKMAINIATFTLRQALEIKFKRICGIYDIYNRNFDGPKLRHDFFPDFINNNKDLFHLPKMELADLIRVYKWTNMTIHNGENPRIWELRFAQDFCRPLFAWGEHTTSVGHYIKSSDGAVIINDYEVLKNRLLTVLEGMAENKQEVYCIEFTSPEAIIDK